MYKNTRQKSSKLNWDLVWLDEYRQFLKLKPGEGFSLETERVVNFLIELKRRGKKAWQRLQALKAIISIGGRELRLPTEHLNDVASKLKILVEREKAAAESGPEIKEIAGQIDPNEPEVIQQLRRRIRLKHQALNTEKSYAKYVNQFIIRFNLADDPRWSRVSRREIEQFLTEMAVEGNVAASTQNVAFSALRYVMVEVLERSFDGIDAMRAGAPSQLPLVLSQDEVARLLAQFTGTELLIARLLYGSGFRLKECLSLRIKDIDFEMNQIVVRDAKGMKSRVTILPKITCQDLRARIAARRIEHQRDLDDGYGAVYLPFALARKYPQAEREFGWQYLFAAKRISRDPRSGAIRRHHLSDDYFGEQFTPAVRQVGSTNLRIRILFGIVSRHIYWKRAWIFGLSSNYWGTRTSRPR